MAYRVTLGVIGVTDLNTSWKEVAFGFVCGKRRRGYRLFRVPYSTRKIAWYQQVYEKNPGERRNG